MSLPDTIVAISSASGPAARMIVRLSGPEAMSLAGTMCHPLPQHGSSSRCRLWVRSMTVPAWAYVFRSPRSYTGEDLVELHIPGNPVLARMVLEELVRRGASQAEAGEFTSRGYLNGRMDLTAAEGVAATISAHNDAELAAARQLLSGELSRRLAPIMDDLAQTLSLVEAGIDFAEEDIRPLSDEELRQRIETARRSLDELLSGSARMERLSHEPTFALVGRPNAGKSTLLNALCGTSRAVVSPVAGTTRDVLSAEVITARGIVRVLDAAGLVEELPENTDSSPHARIAHEMHRRALDAARQADFVILLRDLTDDRPPPTLPVEAHLTVWTKADLGDARPDALCVSALTGLNMPALMRWIEDRAFSATGGASLALNARHVHAVRDAVESLGRALAAEAAEVAAMELHEALDDLGEVLGKVSPDELLGRVFSAFCIGK